MRDSVVFYRSFYEAIKNLQPEDFKNSVRAMLDYALDGKEPETDGIEKTVFLLVKPQIDANNRRYENGKLGGKPKNNQNVTKTEPKSNQTITNSKPNVNVNDNVLKENTLKGVKEKHFVPPTPENVRGYCREKGYNVDAERFVDFYESKGWMIGKNKMKDWKAAVRNWSKQDTQTGRVVPTAKSKFSNFRERDYDFAELERQLINC